MGRLTSDLIKIFIRADFFVDSFFIYLVDFIPLKKHIFIMGGMMAIRTIIMIIMVNNIIFILNSQQCLSVSGVLFDNITGTKRKVIKLISRDVFGLVGYFSLGDKETININSTIIPLINTNTIKILVQ